MEIGEELAEPLATACALPLPDDDDRLENNSGQIGKDHPGVEDYLVFDETTQVCTACDRILESPSYGPLCTACHIFLYPDYTILQKNLDEEKLKRREQQTQPTTSQNVQESRSSIVGHPVSQNRTSYVVGDSKSCSVGDLCHSKSHHSESDSTEDELLGLALLSLYDKDMIDYEAKIFKHVESVIRDDLVEKFPTEILMLIFSYLDEIGLRKAAQVCRRWSVLSDGMENWSVLFEKRWPIFRPVGVVNCWRALYVRMIESSTCVPCFEQGFVKRIPVDDVANSWRNKRLRSELKQLLVDPPEGIRACPIDDEYSHWQASIAGPPDSVYEDGIFYLHLELPRSYPMCPPRVRFLTRILHPNITRHGDVGVDSLRHNWSLALTIPKILVSIQSLLTDPYCHVCMEPVVSRMYTRDRELFDILARDWTHKFAMHHFQSDLSPWQD